jgi:DNA adenine methylase
MKHFVGSKGGAGIAQWLISLMPAHRVYCEPFLGRGVVMNTKSPAAVNIGIDYDAGVIADYVRRCRQTEATRRACPVWTDLAETAIVHGNALAILPVLRVESDWLLYCDPPYLLSTRSCKRSYYRHELLTEKEHGILLSVLTRLPGMVMISGYWSELYAARLDGWRTSSFWTVNRRGKRVQEWVWMNYAAGGKLHDSRFVGNGFTDRQRIRRKAGRWQRKFLAMHDHERQAVLDSFWLCPRA